MNKTELVAAIAEKAELSKKDAEKALAAFTDIVADTLKNGDKIQLVGFGTFEVAEQQEQEETHRQVLIWKSRLPNLRNSKLVKH
jgi:DNA-binding protein HU-beta